MKTQIHTNEFEEQLRCTLLSLNNKVAWTQTHITFPDICCWILISWKLIVDEVLGRSGQGNSPCWFAQAKLPLKLPSFEHRCMPTIQQKVTVYCIVIDGVQLCGQLYLSHLEYRRGAHQLHETRLKWNT